MQEKILLSVRKGTSVSWKRYFCMLNKAFLKRISDFIEDNRLLDKDGKYIVALSGGADSVTLALALKELGYDVEAAHCNFHLRGEESNRDEDFCKAFCQKNDIELHLVHFDTVSFARLHKISIEMAARQLRYSYFRQLKNDINASAVCVAHHKDDTVETVLMNLMRGTGIHGLTGISMKNGDIVRPLLCVFRSEIEDALTLAGQDYVTDSTNLEDDVVRNKIRLDIIPMMREINPSVSDSISKTAARMLQVADVFDSAIESARKRVIISDGNGVVTLSLEALKNEISPEYVLFSILKDYSFTSSQTELIYRSLDAETGRVFRSSTHQLLVDRGRLLIEPVDSNSSRAFVIPEEGTYVYGNGMKFKFERIDISRFELVKSSDCACLDADSVKFPLTIRTVEQGDRFIPFGMKGSKLVSDYLTDRKMNLFDKQRQLVVVDASGKIIWLVSQRPDNCCRITDRTQSVLKITLYK